MAISDTSFFSSYQCFIGTTYASTYSDIYNQVSILPNFVNARQQFLNGMNTTEVTNGLNVVNTHLNSESTYSSSSLSIVSAVLQAVNSFFVSTYGVQTRDWFNSLTPEKTIAWQNSFKEAWYQANAQELVQQVGFATWNGTSFVVYPAYSNKTNIQNTAGVSSVTSLNVKINNFIEPATTFALPGDLILYSNSGSLPNSSNFSLSTALVTGLANTNIIGLTTNIGLNTSLFGFRPIKNSEYFEFRFGTAAVTGLAATRVFSDLVLNVTLNSGIATTVTVGAANTTGRVDIGIYNFNTYLSTGISSITIQSGSANGLGTQRSLELWVKSTF